VPALPRVVAFKPERERASEVRGLICEEHAHSELAGAADRYWHPDRRLGIWTGPFGGSAKQESADRGELNQRSHLSEMQGWRP
jgi:hypothetical protein